MSKELTKKWRDGTLPDGYYYVVSKLSGKIEINDYYEGCWQDLKEEYIKEILEPVPSYDEYRELLDLNVYEKDRKKVMRLEDNVKRLQKQLKEANGVITSYIRNNPLEKYGPAEAYCERWQVK